jgi:purine-binding chemotaxis protein CheW
MNQPAVSSASEQAQFSPALAGAALAATNAPTQLISFAIGDDQYGVDIMAVREIKGWTEITHLPKQPTTSVACSTCAASLSRSSICAADLAKA